MSQLWSWAISVLGLSAFWIAGSGKKWGWLVGIAQEIVFVIYSVIFRQWGFLVSAFIFMGVFGRNYLRARKLERSADESAGLRPRDAGQSGAVS